MAAQPLLPTANSLSTTNSPPHSPCPYPQPARALFTYALTLLLLLTSRMLGGPVAAAVAAGSRLVAAAAQLAWWLAVPPSLLLRGAPKQAPVAGR